MGWLFGKKKIVPKVPFPEGKHFNEKALQFPNKVSEDKVIEPEKIQEAAGLEKPIAPPQEPVPEEQIEVPEEPQAPVDQQEPFVPPTEPFAEQKAEPLYIKMDIYQKILGELGEIKGKLTELRETSKDLVSSEYNEEHKFVKLKRITKAMHDKLLQADKIIFKGD